MLDLTQLRQRCAQGETFHYLFFWGHQRPQDGKITSSCLSQWYEAPFEIDGVRYATAEHWMMAAKARLFGDDQALEKILATPSPKTAKALGRKVKHFEGDVWQANARQLVTEGNVAKFSQNAELGAFLRSTGDHVIVEASPFDRIWGIGLKGDDARAQHPDTWQGQNLLGFALMDVRETLWGSV
jgi:ribA/ribD-fused uncharacterized protein